MQCKAYKFREGTLHEMCNVQGYEFLDFKPILDQCIVKIKVYQVLCHEIFFMIQNQLLDDMLTTMHMMRTRLRQL
jgi:hypothetical protein